MGSSKHPPADVLEPCCSLHHTAFLHLTCTSYTLHVMTEERKKWKLTFYPQTLRDPILLEQEHREKENHSYNKLPDHSFNNMTESSFHLAK